MSTSDECLSGFLKRIDGVGLIATRPLMGDYIIYVEDRPVAALYDDCLFLAVCESSESAFGDAEVRPPYVGAGEMILVPEDVDDSLLRKTVGEMVKEMPIPKACRRFAR